jgi:hypothetical protein
VAVEKREDLFVIIDAQYSGRAIEPFVLEEAKQLMDEQRVGTRLPPNRAVHEAGTAHPAAVEPPVRHDTILPTPTVRNAPRETYKSS